MQSGLAPSWNDVTNIDGWAKIKSVYLLGYQLVFFQKFDDAEGKIHGPVERQSV